MTDYLHERCALPEGVAAVNAGTGVRGMLFDLVLAESKPTAIIVVDAVDMGRPPGEIREIDLEQIPENKIDDFSMHQVPSSNLLRELRDHSGVDVRIFACQIGHIPDEVEPGLTGEVHEAIPRMCELIIDSINGAAKFCGG